MRIHITVIAACWWCAATPVRADDWPQWRGPRRDGVWRESGIIERFEGKELAARWRTPIGPGYAGPAVAGGKVFVSDRSKARGTERVLCLDARAGSILWTHEYPCSYRNVAYDAGPRCTPTVGGDKVYTVGAMGHLTCLDVAAGTPIWSKSYSDDFGMRLPTWGMASAPLLDGRRLIAVVGGADGATVVAFDKDTGAELWRALPPQPIGYAPPIMIEAGGRRQLIVWLAEAIHSLDPENGAVLWREALHAKEGLSVATPVFDGERLMVSSFYNGPLMLRLAKDPPAASVMWRGAGTGELEHETDKLHCLISTPMLDGDAIYGVCSYGAFRVLDAASGERLSSTYEPTGKGRWWNAFLIRNGDRTFLANEQGELIIAALSRAGYKETDRAKLLEPTNRALDRRVVWSHPAFAYRHIFARNDKEIICVNLAAGGGDMAIDPPAAAVAPTLAAQAAPAAPAAGATPPAARKKLIEWGWDEPDTKSIRESIGRMEALPFDGLIFHALGSKGGSLTWETWGPRAFTIDEFKAAIDDLTAAPARRFTDLFLRVNVTPGKVDWFDDQAWSIVVGNFAVAAQLARQGRCKGFMFDVEQYEGGVFDYRQQKHRETKPFDAYRAIVRQRGGEWIRAINRHYPAITILLTFGYRIACEPGDRAKSGYGMLADFLDGILDACSEQTRIVDAWEYSYPYKRIDQFREARKSILETSLGWTAVPEKYRRHVTAGFGLWLDHDWRGKGWNLEDFSKNHFTPAEFEAAARAALEVSDEYVWIYAEQPRWWTNERLPKEYVDAVAAARAASQAAK